MPASFETPPSSLIQVLSLRDRVMVLLAGSTGMRRSELVALRWKDVDFALRQVNITRSIYRNKNLDLQDEGESSSRSAAPGCDRAVGGMAKGQ